MKTALENEAALVLAEIDPVTAARCAVRAGRAQPKWERANEELLLRAFCFVAVLALASWAQR